MRSGSDRAAARCSRCSRRRARTPPQIALAVEQRFREYPAAPSRRRRSRSSSTKATGSSRTCSARSSAQFVTPYDRQDIVTLAFAVDEVPDKIENASELLGLYGVESPTRQSLELCGLLVRATERARALLGRLKGLRGSAPRDPRDQGDRGRGRPTSPAPPAPASSRTTGSTP